MAIQAHEKEDGKFVVQEPPEGPFDREALQWQSHAAYIPYHRVRDFICGEENNKRFPTKFYRCKKYDPVHGSPKRKGEGEPYVERICYHCSYGPDHGTKRKKGGDTRGEEDGGGGNQREGSHDGSFQGDERDIDSQKLRKKGFKRLGCLCNFEVRRVNTHPAVARLFYECVEHVNSEGGLCHGTIETSSTTRETCVIGFSGQELSVAREPSPGSVEVMTPKVVEAITQIRSELPGYTSTFEEILKIETRIKTMLYKHPPLLVDYCSLLDVLEENLKKALASKEVAAAAVQDRPIGIASSGFGTASSGFGIASSGFGVNVKEVLEGNQALTSIQYPPAPPIRYSSPGSGVDWLKLLARTQGSGPIPLPPPPPLKDGMQSAFDWKKIAVGQSVASIYIPPAPPVKENAGGFDWKKALAQAQTPAPGHNPQNPPFSGNSGFLSGWKQALEGHQSSSTIHIPPAPVLRYNPTTAIDWRQALEIGRSSGRRAAETSQDQIPVHASTSKRHRSSNPANGQGHGSSDFTVQHEFLHRPRVIQSERVPTQKGQSDNEDLRDTSEDTTSG